VVPPWLRQIDPVPAATEDADGEGGGAGSCARLTAGDLALVPGGANSRKAIELAYFKTEMNEIKKMGADELKGHCAKFKLTYQGLDKAKLALMQHLAGEYKFVLPNAWLTAPLLKLLKVEDGEEPAAKRPADHASPQKVPLGTALTRAASLFSE
jgi:hypothetical protein